MAYSLDDFYPDPRGGGYRIHTYSSTDVEAVVAASGYFDNGTTKQTGVRNIVNVGDKISCYDSTTDINYALRVAAITSGVITTDVLGAGRTEVVTTTNILLGAETGTHYVLNATGAFVTTLPALKLGLEFWFHIGATEPTTTHTIVSAPSAKIQGNITSKIGTTVVCVADADSINFIASKALHGDYVHVWCDGSFWYIDGMCAAFDGMTTTAA